MSNWCAGSTTDELSNLFHIVKVMDRPVIGLSFVWECRVVPPKLPTFYLCESCRQTISVNEIYEHMASAEHRWKYIMRQYPRFMFWIEEELIPEMIDDLTNDIAGWVFCREELMDAQPVLLSEECFEWVRTAPFVEALSVVQRIKQEKKTTTLPLIVTSQNDLPNQMEMPLLEEDRRTTDSDHAIHGLDGNAAYANAESRPSPTEYLPFPHITHRPPCSIFSHQEISEPENEARSDISTPLSQISEPLVSQPPSTSPPEIPEHIPSCSVNQNMPASPKYENQEDVEPENTVRADVSTPLSHDSAVGSPGPIDSIGTTTLKDTSNNTTHETEIKPKLPSVHEICSSAEISKHNENVFKPIQEENVALEGSPRHSSVLTGESTSLASSTAKCNDTTSPDLDADMFQMLINLIKQSKPSVNLEESCTTVCDAPRPTRWDLGPPPNTKSEAAPKDYSMTYSEDMMSTVITSESSVSKENTEKPTAVTIELSKEIHKMTSSSEITVIQQDEEIKTEEIRIQEVKMKNSQGAMQTSQPKIQVSHNEDQLKEFNIDGGVQTSQQKQELQVTSDTPVVPSQCPTPQSQDQMQREPLNTGTVQIQQTQVQVQQSQVVQLQPQIEVAPSQHAIQQTQGHPQQRPIYARVTTRPQNTLYLPGDGDDGQNISVNTSFQMSQGLPVNTITSNSLVLTGYGHFVETSYPTTGNIGSILNIPVQHIYSHSSAYPSHVHHQLHAQQCYTLMQPFIQNVPNPGASEWFNTNGQLQPGAQTHVAWSNGAAAGTTNVVYSNAVQFNTASLQSYTNVQEYNRVSMQNHSHTQSFPGSMDSQSFPLRQ